MKALLFRLSPPPLRLLYGRVEASPLGYRLAKGAFWSLVGAVISRALGLLAAILVGRLLGKQEYGELGIIQSTIGVFGTVAGLGMGLTANKHVAQFKRSDPARAGRILALASATAWISSGILAMILFCCAPWLAATALAAPHLSRSLQIGALLLLLSGVNGAQTGALSGFEAFKAIARINLIAGAITFPLMVIGAWKFGVVGAVWGLAGSQLANCLMSFMAVRAETHGHRISLHPAGCLSELGLFWRFSLPAVLTGVLNSSVAWGASALIVNQAGGYGDMGIYNAALRVKLLPETFLGMLIAPILPILSEAFGKSDHRTFERTLLFSFGLATVIIMPAALIQTAAPALAMLPFGADYAGRGEVVQWLMVQAVAYALMFPMGSILISMGEMWFSWLANFGYVSLLGICVWYLVPRYGAAGYAAGGAIAYCIGSIPCLLFLYRRQPEVMKRLRWRTLAVASALLLASCAAASRTLPVSGAIICGAASSFTALWFLLILWRRITPLVPQRLPVSQARRWSL